MGRRTTLNRVFRDAERRTALRVRLDAARSTGATRREQWRTAVHPRCPAGRIAMLAVLASATFGETRQPVSAARAMVVEPPEREELPVAIETAKDSFARSARLPAIGTRAPGSAIVEERGSRLAALEWVGERLGRAARSDGVDQWIAVSAHVRLPAIDRATDSPADIVLDDAEGSATGSAGWLVGGVRSAGRRRSIRTARRARAGNARRRHGVCGRCPARHRDDRVGPWYD